MQNYGTKLIENNWFSFYLQNRTKFVSINGFDSDVTAICCGVPHRSYTGTTTFSNLHK